MAAADTAIANEIGIAPEIVEAYRRHSLTENVDWLRAPKTGKISFTDQGRQAILKNFGPPPLNLPTTAEAVEELEKRDPLPPAELPPSLSAEAILDRIHGRAPRPPIIKPQGPETKKEAPTDALLPIVRIPPNDQWVQVRLPDGSIDKVRVRDNQRLQVRHLLRCRINGTVITCTQPGIAP